MVYKTHLVAKIFKFNAEKAGITIETKKMNQLIYIANGICLSKKSVPLVDEAPIAHISGMFFPMLCIAEFNDPKLDKGFKQASYFCHSDDPIYSNTYTEQYTSTEDSKIINNVWIDFGNHTVADLEKFTMDTTSAWYQTRLNYRGPLPINAVISTDLIKEEFKKKAWS